MTITVESEYLGPGNSIYKYITSDNNGNGGLFGCINATRGSTLIIYAVGEEVELVSHPLKITHYNDQGQAMAPLSNVARAELTEGPTYDGTYSLTWTVPNDATIDKYQYQCENHAHMRGTIHVSDPSYRVSIWIQDTTNYGSRYDKNGSIFQLSEIEFYDKFDNKLTITSSGKESTNFDGLYE